MKLSFSAVTHAYARLAPRERLLVQLAAAVTGIVILWALISTVGAAQASLERQIETREEQLEKLQALRREYLALQRETELLTATYADRPENFSLFSFLEGVGSKTVSREKILAMSPSSKTVGDRYVEESVEMRLSKVTLPEVVDLIFHVENAPTPLRVTRMKMKKRYDDSYTFDVTVVVSTVVQAS